MLVLAVTQQHLQIMDTATVFPHVSVGVCRDVAGGWNAGVNLALGSLGLVVQERGDSLNADERVVVCLQEVLERNMAYLINNVTR